MIEAYLSGVHACDMQGVWAWGRYGVNKSIGFGGLEDNQKNTFFKAI